MDTGPAGQTLLPRKVRVDLLHPICSDRRVVGRKEGSAVSIPSPSVSDLTTVTVREQSRRGILAKVGLAAGTVGLGILAKAPPARAADGSGLDFEDLQF